MARPLAASWPMKAFTSVSDNHTGQEIYHPFANGSTVPGIGCDSMF